MRTVFLDLDGTLSDPAEGLLDCINHALVRMGLPAQDVAGMGWMIGPALLDTFAKLGVSDPEEALGHYRERYTQTGMFQNTVYPGIPQALRELAQAGYACVLMTAKPHVYARRITAHFGLSPMLTAEYGPELDGTRNDKAELLAHAMAELSTNPAKAVMVGDRRYDIAAGQANGIATIAAGWGYGNADEHLGATCVADAPNALVDCVKKLI